MKGAHQMKAAPGASRHDLSIVIYVTRSVPRHCGGLSFLPLLKAIVAASMVLVRCSDAFDLPTNCHGHRRCHAALRHRDCASRGLDNMLDRAATDDTRPTAATEKESRASESKLLEMEAWLDTIGVDRRGGTSGPPATRLKSFAGKGIGLEATLEIERDSTVASIPRSACLSSDARDAPVGSLRAWAHDLMAAAPVSTGQITPTSPVKDAAFDRDVAVVTLQVFLEEMVGALSAFEPWMNTIRQKQSLNLPALWPAEELGLLEGTLVLREVRKCLASAASERNFVAAAITKGRACGRTSDNADASLNTRWLERHEMKGRPTSTEWLHTRCIVQSRAYRVGRRYLLIPLVDFANHDDDVAFAVCPGDGVFTDPNEVVFAADRSYTPGMEVCTTYGDMDNAKRLLSFGFVTLNRLSQRFDPRTARLALPTEAFCDVTFPVDGRDPCRSFKRRVLEGYPGQIEDGLLVLSAAFPLEPYPKFVSQLVEGPASCFVKSIMPLLRLIVLSAKDFTCIVLPDLRQEHPGQSYNVDGVEGTMSEKIDVSFDSDGGPHDGRRDMGGSPTRAPWSGSILASAGGDQILARLATRVSDANELEALRLLTGQCMTHLDAIGLTSRDCQALREASFENEDCGDVLIVTEPVSLLCATVRVGEAMAWYAILEACARIRAPDAGTTAEEQTWAAWVSKQCMNTEPLTK